MRLLESTSCARKELKSLHIYNRSSSKETTTKQISQCSYKQTGSTTDDRSSYDILTMFFN